MAEEQGSQEDKTEQPTERKREESRKEGMVTFSREVTFLFGLGGFIVTFFFAGSYFLSETARYFRTPFQDFNPYTKDLNALLDFTSEIISRSVMIYVGLFLVLLVVGILGSIIQVGFSFHTKPLQPSLDKLNPFTGITRIFGKSVWGNAVIISAKCILVGYILYAVISDNMITLLNLTALDSKNFFTETAFIIWEFLYRLFIAYFIIAAADYAFRRWLNEMKLKMSKQEIKDEMKQTEGDPHVKARIREAQRKMSQARMLQNVPNADVIVTNPTHFAVALQYDRDTMVAPTMIAKGADFMALRIMDIAKKNDVPIMRNPPVAREMYANVEIGDEVPENLYKAVAEILAFVYRQKNRRVS